MSLNNLIDLYSQSNTQQKPNLNPGINNSKVYTHLIIWLVLIVM